MDSVTPISPVAPYLGGKKHLAAQIVELINATPHETYAEVFVGMGGIFFRRTLRPKVEVINDFSRDVSNLFRILSRHLPQFLDVLKWQVASRAEFERLMRVDADTLTDLERAARFLYLQRTAFGGKVTGRNFGISPGRPSRFDLTRLVPMLDDVHERLAGVTIERMNYREFLARYDTTATLFYLDPPYYGCEEDYGPIFSRDEFALMAEQLAGLQGKFILSLNDHPDVRDIFRDFIIRSVETQYSVSGEAQKVGEVLISNYHGVLRHEQASLI